MLPIFIVFLESLCVLVLMLGFTSSEPALLEVNADEPELASRDVSGRFWNKDDVGVGALSGKASFAPFSHIFIFII